MTTYYEKPGIAIHHGDALAILPTLEAESVNCCITSPPYWGLRDYGVDGQIGLEETPEAYVKKIVTVFRKVWRVLRNDGTLWLNLGDSYASREVGRHDSVQKRKIDGKPITAKAKVRQQIQQQTCLKPKNLLGIPWRVAFALQAEGWYLRSDIIWHKPDPMPESVTDRPTKAHEYVFLMSKSKLYWYDKDAIAEPSTGQNGQATDFARTTKDHIIPNQSVAQHRVNRKPTQNTSKRNRRTVWTIPTSHYSDAHFATFPPALIEPMVLAGCPVDGVVLDPFAGSGTTAEVALHHGRQAVMIELNADYLPLQVRRIERELAQPHLFFTQATATPPPTQDALF